MFLKIFSWKTMKILSFLLLFLFCFVFTPAPVSCELRSDQEFWKGMARTELEEALKVTWNLNVARNVIVFIGDGMDPNTVTATRIYKSGESSKLSFEKFPHVGLLKTYSANKMVPDSGSTATALLCGVKVNHETLGVDSTVQKGDCVQSLNKNTRLQSLVVHAQNAGKSTGLVTTMRVTHATPAPLYAHSASRRWECEANMPTGSPCKDIARQLIEDEPGRNINVILGGGMQMFKSNVTGTSSDPIDTWSCASRDGRNLIEDYKADKRRRGLKYSTVYNTRELKSFNVGETDYLLGIFANGHLMLEHERNQSPEGMPSISDMTEAAIKVLSKNQHGYFLMVEGGNIDMSHHRGKAKRAVGETAAMDEAVKVVMDMTDERDTLVVVTSDHTHTLSINGYPPRGSNIFGVAQASSYDGINYTTLSYSTGGPGSYQFEARTKDNNETHVLRRDASKVDTDSYEYEQVAAIRLIENSHGGGDVTIYARGPHSHLFHTVHEQHYVYHAISYAAKIGQFSSSSKLKSNFLISLVILFLCFICR